MSGWWIAIVAALSGGLIGTYVVRAAARRLNIVNHPNPIIPQHARPIAYLGGVGVLIGCAAGFITMGAEHQPPAGIVTAAIAFTVMGLIDDLRPYRPLIKFLLQSAIAGVAVHLGVTANLTGVTLIDQVLSLFWIVGVVNAFNFTDVCDGLVGSITASTLIAFSIFDETSGLTAAVAAAAFLGFLPFNLPRASIFLGDAGSHLAGFLVAAMALLMPSGGGIHAIQMILVAAVPIFELVFITTVRIHKGLPWWKGSPDHFSLRLQQAAWPRLVIDIVASILAFTFAILGHQIALQSADVVAGILTGFLFIAAFAARFLLGHEVRRP